mgnify:CR=1 FL=1
MKSDRLKKLESELKDLEQWLKLGLVPKKDVEKHKGEIQVLSDRIAEEKNRLQQIKENGDQEEYSAPKRNSQNRASYQEHHTIPGAGGGSSSGLTDAGLGNDSSSAFETDTGSVAEEDASSSALDEDDEDPFSDKNRWRRGILEDPDADSW